jgi:hypothetical protein
MIPARSSRRLARLRITTSSTPARRLTGAVRDASVRGGVRIRLGGQCCLLALPSGLLDDLNEHLVDFPCNLIEEIQILELFEECRVLLSGLAMCRERRDVEIQRVQIHNAPPSYGR